MVHEALPIRGATLPAPSGESKAQSGEGIDFLVRGLAAGSDAPNFSGVEALDVRAFMDAPDAVWVRRSTS
jgi:hypothetical protein